MWPERAARVTRIAAEVNRQVTGYMLGNCATSIIAGITIFITLVILGVPAALLWALWFALLDLVPTFGAALAGIPIILFAVSRSPVEGIVTLIVCVVYNLAESHVLIPAIMGRTVWISPLLTVISVLIGASLGVLISGPFGGLVGALLAIPTAGMIQVLVREIWMATSPKVLPDFAEADAEGELLPVPPDRTEQADQLRADTARDNDEFRSALQRAFDLH